MTDITALKNSYVEVETYEEAQEMANNGFVQVIMSKVGNRVVRVMAPNDFFVDEEDRLAKTTEFATWFTETFSPDTSKVVPKYPVIPLPPNTDAADEAAARQ